MIFDCHVKFKNQAHGDATVLILKDSAGNGVLVTYCESLSDIRVFNVVGGKMSIDVDCLSRRKQQAQPKGILSVLYGKVNLYFKNCSRDAYTFVNSTNEISETDFSNFTPIDKFDLCNLKQLCPKMKLQDIAYRSTYAGLTEWLKDKTSHDAITELNLSNSNLSTFPKEIRYFKSLRHLWLISNQIMDLNEELFGLESGLIKTLKHLNLSRNQIKKLPLSFFNLQNLETLHLADNKLDCIPNAIEKLNKLKTFSAANNRLTFLPATILKLPIRAASISRNPLLKLDDQPIRLTTQQDTFPSLFEIALNALYKIPSEFEKVPLILQFLVRAEERETCLCGCKIFAASARVIMQVSFRNFAPQKFPVELVCCSSRCFLQQKLELMKPDHEDSDKIRKFSYQF